MGSPIVYLTLTKWLWDSHVGKLDKNTMGMGMDRIIEQMGKVDSKNQTKAVILEKWLIMTTNWRCYKHPPIAPPNLGANLTLHKHHEPLFHTRHKSLHQTNEN